MSIILLTAPPHAFEDLRTRDQDACFVPSTDAILCTKDAAVNTSTKDMLLKRAHVTNRVPDLKYERVRTHHMIPGTPYCLRITEFIGELHIQGPKNFFNVGHKMGVPNPSGIYMLYEGEPDFVNVKTMSLETAFDAYYLARSFTHSFYPSFPKWALHQSLLMTEAEIATLKKETFRLLALTMEERKKELIQKNMCQLFHECKDEDGEWKRNIKLYKQEAATMADTMLAKRI